MAAQSSIFPTPVRIAVSACLLGERVRYDGEEKSHPLIIKLAQEFVLQPFCPEVAIGLEVPRAPVQLVATSTGIRAQGVVDPGHDISDRLQAYAQSQCAALKSCAGVIFKSRSPSCGLGSSPLFDEQGEQTGKTSGLFAAVLQDCLPGVPMVEESALMTGAELAIFAGRVRNYNALSPGPSPACGRGVNMSWTGGRERAPLLKYAKQLRSNQTEAEQRLWYHLRGKRFMSLKFKRQKPIGPYIVDFVCMGYKLVIEADGGQHGDNADAKRDAWFASQGFTLLRFWNNEILEQTDAVLEKIRQVVIALSPNPSPIHGRGK